MRRLAIGIRVLTVVGMAASLAACGSDGPTEPEVHLSVQEATTLASALLTEVSAALDNAGLSLNRLPANPARLSGANLSAMPTQSFNSNCMNGGKISGSMTYTDNTNSNGTGSISATMTVTPQACRVSTGSQLIAVNGSLVYTLNATFVNAEVGDMTFGGKGAINWSGGSCSMDYSLRITAAGTATLKGVVCGQAINQTIDLNFLRRP